MVVVKADDVTSPEVVTAINSLEEKAAERPGLFEGEATVELSDDQTVAIVTMPITGEGTSGKANQAADVLRNDLVPSTLGELDGVEAHTSGEASMTGDFNDAMIGNLPYVFAFVLSAAFPAAAGHLPVTGDPGQGDRAQPAVRRLGLRAAHAGVRGRGHRRLAAAVPVRDPVRSMDYRVHPDRHPRGLRSRHDDRGCGRARDQEHRRRGHERRDRHGRRVLDVRAVLGSQMQQLGIGLAAAVLIDATIIRGVLLPSAMKLLGDRNWWLPERLGWVSRGQRGSGGGARLRERIAPARASPRPRARRPS